MSEVYLRQDAEAVRKMLRSAVRDYSTRQHSPVTRIDLSFSLGDSESTPWVHLSFDTKPGSEPDGNPTHPDFARLEFESWLPAVQAVCDGQNVTVLGIDGNSKECDDARLGQEVGQFLVSVLLGERSVGTFARLPKAEHCELGVEDPTTGEFGWPNYEDRGKNNLA